MSQEHDHAQPDDASVHQGIHTEPPPFEEGYHPESLPKITVPDLPHDAQGLSAEALAQVPTLTDWVEAPADAAPEAVVAPSAQEVAEAAAPTPEPEAPIQDMPVEADTWGEVLQARMGRLTDDIHKLNTRLDRLEERNKTKV